MPVLLEKLLMNRRLYRAIEWVERREE